MKNDNRYRVTFYCDGTILERQICEGKYDLEFLEKNTEERIAELYNNIPNFMYDYYVIECLDDGRVIKKDNKTELDYRNLYLIVIYDRDNEVIEQYYQLYPSFEGVVDLIDDYVDMLDHSGYDVIRYDIYLSPIYYNPYTAKWPDNISDNKYTKYTKKNIRG